MKKEKVYEIIYKAIDELNLQQSENIYEIEKKPDSPLYEGSSGLDSMGLVNLLFGIEDILSSEYDVAVSLTDEKAMSQENSPFRSVETLAIYISKLEIKNWKFFLLLELVRE